MYYTTILTRETLPLSRCIPLGCGAFWHRAKHASETFRRFITSGETLFPPTPSAQGYFITPATLRPNVPPLDHGQRNAGPGMFYFFLFNRLDYINGRAVGKKRVLAMLVFFKNCAWLRSCSKAFLPVAFPRRYSESVGSEGMSLFLSSKGI